MNQKIRCILCFCRLAGERRACVCLAAFRSSHLCQPKQILRAASKRHELKQLVSEQGVSTVLALKRGDYSSLIIPFPIRKLSHAERRAPSSVLATCTARKIYFSNKVFAVKLNENEEASLLIIYFALNER